MALASYAVVTASGKVFLKRGTPATKTDAAIDPKMNFLEKTWNAMNTGLGKLLVKTGIIEKFVGSGKDRAGITLGEFIYPDETDPHELFHVGQYALLGPLYIPLYALASGINMMFAYAGGLNRADLMGSLYQSNIFEISAYLRTGTR